MARAERTSFDTALRFELVSEEGRALAGSYSIAMLAALAWLTLVHIVPRPSVGHPGDPLVVLFDHPELVPPTGAPSHRSTAGVRATSSRSGAFNSSTIQDAFRGGSGRASGGNPLHGVTVTPSGTSGGQPMPRAVALGTGPGLGTPGRGRPDGVGPGGLGLGKVGAGGVPRANVAIALPEVRAVSAGSSRGDVSEVGRTARAHAAQLERCYHDEGLTRNPALAGIVRLAIEVDGGRVSSARVVYRSWSGSGAAETESCLIAAIQGWRLGTSSASLTLPFSFTSSAR